MLITSQSLYSSLKLIAGVLAFYAAYLLFLFIVQRALIYPRGFMGPAGVPELKRYGIQQIWLDTRYGKIETWYLPPVGVSKDRPPVPIVIFAHGNAELIDYNVDEMMPFRQLGMGVLLVEYPGYGRSSGSPSQKGITAGFIAAYDMLLERKIADPEKIVLYGRSLGGGAVCALAALRSSAGLILMSTFTSIRSFAIRYGAPGFLVRDPFDNLQIVENYPNPILIIHGRYDNVIPYRHGLKLHQAAPGSRMISYECAHNDCPPDWNSYNDSIADYLAQINVIASVEK